MDAAQVLAFRLARSGLAERGARTLADAAACPVQDFSRDAALLALAARADGVTREDWRDAIDGGELVLAHVIRGAIHAIAPADAAMYGPALIGRDDEEIGPQLGRSVQLQLAEHGIAPSVALDEVAAATADALADGAALDRVELHAALRERVRPELLPWCRGCASHHVAPMLWRYATVKAGVRMDSERRYVLPDAQARAGTGSHPEARADARARTQARARTHAHTDPDARADAAEPDPATGALRAFLRFYAPAGPGDFAEWAGLARPHAGRLWETVAGDLAEVQVGRARAWALGEDLPALESPPEAHGVRLLPPGDPYLQKPNRALLAPAADLRKRLFRPVASPGAVLRDGRLVGLWRAKAKGRKVEITVEKVGRVARGDLEEEAGRVARARGAAEAVVSVS